jgi:hypothetical protein
MAPSEALTEPFVSTLATLPFAAFWCTALNRNSRIVGQAGRGGFLPLHVVVRVSLFAFAM